MDIDKLVRINSLSRDLQRHGIAINSLDAVHQACIAVEEAPLQTMQEMHEQNGTVIIMEEQTQKPISPLQERRFELLLEMNNRKYDQELQTLKLTIASMSTQLEQMRLELKNMSEKPLLAKRPEKQEMLPAQAKENHPRQGAFTPSDVPIDKIFYFGNGGNKR